MVVAVGLRVVMALSPSFRLALPPSYVGDHGPDTGWIVRDRQRLATWNDSSQVGNLSCRFTSATVVAVQGVIVGAVAVVAAVGVRVVVAPSSSFRSAFSSSYRLLKCL